MIRDCNTCARHKQGQMPDETCQLCLACTQVSSTTYLPDWTPMSKAYDETFRTEQSLGPAVCVGPVTQAAPKTALDVQVGGSHYKGMKIQPVEFAAVNGLDFFQKDVIKYVTRRKGDVEKRIEDLNKAKHYIDLYIDFIKKGVVQ